MISAIDIVPILSLNILILLARENADQIPLADQPFSWISEFQSGSDDFSLTALVRGNSLTR